VTRTQINEATRIGKPVWRAGKRKSFSFPTCRLREIERVIPTLDLDQITELLPEVAATLWTILSQRGRPVLDDELPTRIREWLHRVGAPIFDNLEIHIAAELAKRRDRLARADDLAEILDLKYADRQRLAVCTIGAVDVSKRERAAARKQRKRERDRIRAAIKRRKRGAVSREEYLAESLSRTRPWEREGISRSTWERRRRRRDASPSPPQRVIPRDGLASNGTESPLARRERVGLLAPSGLGTRYRCRRGTWRRKSGGNHPRIVGVMT
jgi:hypothetical protein